MFGLKLCSVIPRNLVQKNLFTSFLIHPFSSFPLQQYIVWFSQLEQKSPVPGPGALGSESMMGQVRTRGTQYSSVWLWTHQSIQYVSWSQQLSFSLRLVVDAGGPCLVPWPQDWCSGSLAITGLSWGPGCCSRLSCDSLSGSPRAPGSWPGSLGTSSTGLCPHGKQGAPWRVTFLRLGPRGHESCQLWATVLPLTSTPLSGGAVPRPEVQARMDGKLNNKNVSKLDLQWYLDRGQETQGRDFLHVNNFASRAGSWGPSSTTWTPPFMSSLLNLDCPLGKVTGCGFGGLCPAFCSWHLDTGRGAPMLPVSFSPSFKGGADGSVLYHHCTHVKSPDLHLEEHGGENAMRKLWMKQGALCGH